MKNLGQIFCLACATILLSLPANSQNIRLKPLKQMLREAQQKTEPALNAPQNKTSATKTVPPTTPTSTAKSPTKTKQSSRHTFTCHFGQQSDMTFTLDFNDSLAQVYLSKRPVKGKDLEAYYQEFLKPLPEDDIVAELATAIKEVAPNDKQSQCEIAVALIQDLPYNYAECGPNAIPICDWPYITLYRGSGTCLDKAILGIALLKKLDIACAMLYFPAIPVPGSAHTDDHISLGLKNTKSNRSLFSGYIYTEVANFDYIGYVPKVYAEGYLQNDPLSENIEHNRQNAKILESNKKAQIFLASDGYHYLLNY